MARRRYQKGRVFLRGKTRMVWVGRWREDIVQQDGTIRRIHRSAVLGTKAEILTKRIAQRRLELTLGPINSPDYRPGRLATVEDFSEKWRREVLSQRKLSTVQAAVSHLRCHINPQLGRLRMDELDQERQQTFVTHLSQTASRKTVLNVLGTLSSMLVTARKWGYVCGAVKVSELALPDEGVKPEARFFTPEQVRQIIALAQQPFRTMFCVVAMTGIRSGELLALTVDDLDFAARRIFIRRSVNSGKIQSVKSKASQRPLPMPEPLTSILEEYLENWRENPARWLFPNRRNKPYGADKVVMSKLWPVLDRLGIPHCGLHAFRHTHASLLLDVGAPPQVAQAQLRHSDPRITLGIYSHVIGDSQRSAVEKVAQILCPVVPKSAVSSERIH